MIHIKTHLIYNLQNKSYMIQYMIDKIQQFDGWKFPPTYPGQFFRPALGRGNFEKFTKNQVFNIFKIWLYIRAVHCLARIISEIQIFILLNNDLRGMVAPKDKHVLNLVYLRLMFDSNSRFLLFLAVLYIVGKRKKSSTKCISRIFDKIICSKVISDYPTISQ